MPLLPATRVRANDIGRGFALAATVAPLAIGAFAARALAARHPREFDVDFAQTLVVATAWHRYGTEAFAILALAVASCAVALVATVARLRTDARSSDLGAILVAASLGLASAFAWPFVFSSDVYAYAAYGHLALHGIDPYRPAPALPFDAFVTAARWQWRGPFPVDVYGPATVGLDRAIVAAAGDTSVGAALSALRAAAAVAFLASIACLHAALARRPPPERFVLVCAVGLHPVVLWSVAEGHNDAFVMFVGSLGALAVARGRPILAAAAIGATPVLKATGALLAGGYALAVWTGTLAPRSRRAALATLGTLVVAAAIALPPLVPALRHVARAGRYSPDLSLQGLVGLGAAAVCAAAALGVGAVRIVRGDRRGFAWLGIALVLALPNAYPWYALWLVPWALAGGEGSASAGLWLATIFAVVRYVPDASQMPDVGTAGYLTVADLAPLGLALTDFLPRRRSKKAAHS